MYTLLLKKSKIIVLVAAMLFSAVCLASCGKDPATAEESGKVSYVYEYEDGEDGEENNDGGASSNLGSNTGGNSGAGKSTSSKSSGKSSSSKSSTSSRPVANIDADTGPATVTGINDIKGKTFVIAAENSGILVPHSESASSGATVKPKTSYQKEREQAYKDIESKYGFKFSYKLYSDYESLNKAAVTAIAANTKFADLMVMKGNTITLRSIVESKIARDLNQFPEFDLDNSNLYIQTYLDQMQVYGKNALAYPVISDPGKATLGLAFNKAVLENACGMTASQLYKLVNEKKWTITKMQELSKKAYKKAMYGASPDGDQWGLVGRDIRQYISIAVYMSAGGSPVSKSAADGTYTVTANNSASISALTLMQNWMTKDDSVRKQTQGSWDDQQKSFEKGWALFYATSPYYVPDLVTTGNLQYGMIPFPLSKEGGEYKSSIASYSAQGIVIPVNNSRNDIALTGYLMKELIPAIKKIDDKESGNVINQLNAKDTEIVKMSDLIVKSGHMIPPCGSFENAVHAVYGGNSPSTEINGRMTEFNIAVNTYNKNYKDLQ